MSQPSYLHGASTVAVMHMLCGHQGRVEESSMWKRWLWAGRPINMVKMAEHVLYKAVCSGPCVELVEQNSFK